MSRGKSIYHYATKSDYLLMIQDVAVQLAVKYTVDEWLLEPNHRVYASPLDAPNFDLFKWGRSPGTMFFVLPNDGKLPFKHMPQRQVPEKYGFFFENADETLDYRWISFHPSGFYKSEELGEGLLQGNLSTNSNHSDSLAIFNAFKKSIKNRFEYFQYSGVYVGPEAVNYFESGGRLTDDLRSPISRDIKRTVLGV